MFKYKVKTIILKHKKNLLEKTFLIFNLLIFLILHLIYMNIWPIILIRKQHINPMKVGIKMETIVHFKLLVSFFIVRQVVEQGQWIKEKVITHKAVIIVQLLAKNKFFKTVKSVISVILPRDI